MIWYHIKICDKNTSTYTYIFRSNKQIRTVTRTELTTLVGQNFDTFWNYKCFNIGIKMELRPKFEGLKSIFKKY